MISEQPNNTESPEEHQPQQSRPRKKSSFDNFVGQILSGNILTRAEVRRQYPYVLLVAGLMFVYIAVGYNIQKLHRHSNNLTEQVKDLRNRSLTMSSMRMEATRESEIIKELERRGIPLMEATTPPEIIDR